MVVDVSLSNTGGLSAVNYFWTRGQLKLILNSCQKPVALAALFSCTCNDAPRWRLAAVAAADRAGTAGWACPAELAA